MIISNFPQKAGGVESFNGRSGAVLPQAGDYTYSDVGAAAASHGTHVTFDDTNNPAMDGTAAKGSATTVARSDHVHPTDTSRAAASDLTSHTGNTNVHVTAAEKQTWNTHASGILLFEDVSVPATSWEASASDYAYEADISLVGVTASHYPEVIFDEDDVSDYSLASIVDSGAGTITIYADQLPTNTIVIPSISCSGMNAPSSEFEDIIGVLSPRISGAVDLHDLDADAHGDLFDAKADQSDLTGHIGNTNVHITANERTAWNAKQEALTFDTTPTAGSSNPVTSDGLNTLANDLVTTINATVAPKSHASSATTYGTGTSANYGHVKLSDSTTSTSSTSGGIAATPAAVKSVKDTTLPLAGGNMTGAITFDYTGKTIAAGANESILAVKFKNTSGSLEHVTYPIAIIGNNSTSDAYNSGIRMGSTNGTTVVAAGESATTFSSKNSKFNDESLYLVADGQVLIVKAANDGTISLGPLVAAGFGATPASGQLVVTSGTAGDIRSSGAALNTSGGVPRYQYSTTNLTAGSSSLTTGQLYFVYE